MSPGLTFHAPSSPAGSYKIYVVGQTSHTVAVTTLRIMPTLSVSPTSGHAGAAVLVAGTGYAANETVQIIFDCATSTCAVPPGLILGTPQTNTSGDFTNIMVTVPTTATLGTHSIGGIGLVSHAFATTGFTVK